MRMSNCTPGARNSSMQKFRLWQFFCVTHRDRLGYAWLGDVQRPREWYRCFGRLPVVLEGSNVGEVRVPPERQRGRKK